MMLSEEFQKRAKDKLDAAAAGKFFASTNARLLPSFDRGGGSAAADDKEECNDDEFTLGTKLGEGAFCDVMEITAIVLKRDSNGNENPSSNGHTNSNGNENGHFCLIPEPKETRTSTCFLEETDEADFPVNFFQSKSEIRKYMSENCMRQDANVGDQARYALKQLKPTDSQKQLEQGLIDISIEAKFLACINHPNIIKMRAIAGETLSPNFGIVLDRLYSTLEDKMDSWTEQKKEAKSGGLCGCLFGGVDPFVKATIESSAVTIAYDLSCALRYIHSQNLVYRDIKPENAGFDVRGDIKLFDFGFCKELRRKIFDKPSGFYKLTKMTGSPPYMAPENFLGKPYGKPVDVFSFAVLMWEMLHNKFAFYHYNRQDYKELVVQKNFRPSIDSSISSRLQELIKEAWDPDPKKRPTFDRISLLLRAEYQELGMKADASINIGLSRSERLLGQSMRSFRANRKK